MRDAVGIAVLAVLVVVVLLAMRAGWRHRAQRSATLVPVLPPVPADLGAARTGPVEATYVSTTVAGDWLDRVVAHDLGVRSGATVQVHDHAVVVRRQGARDLVLPADVLRDAALAPGIAGKVVGGDGVVVLRWEASAARGALPPGQDGPAPTVLDTGLRPRRAADRQVLVEAVRGLLAEPAATAPGAPLSTDTTKEQSA